MKYTMKLAPKYFYKVKDGKKTIECRLYDGKRKMLKTDDLIEFSNARNESDRISTKITALHTFPSFEELLDKFPIASFGAENKSQLLHVLNGFYSHEDQKKYGVVGLEIKLI